MAKHEILVREHNKRLAYNAGGVTTWKVPKRERPQCGARTRAGGLCAARVVVRKDGSYCARCRIHGGAAPQTRARQIVVSMPDPLNYIREEAEALFPELASVPDPRDAWPSWLSKPQGRELSEIHRDVIAALRADGMSEKIVREMERAFKESRARARAEKRAEREQNEEPR